MARKIESIAVIDVGSSKVACFYAENENGQLVVKGVGHQLCQGFRAGVVTNAKALETSILAAVHTAEEMAGEPIDHVYLNVSGPSVASKIVSMEMHLGQSEVSQRDIDRLIENGLRSFGRDLNVAIDCIPVEYALDGMTGITDPRGMFASKMEARLNVITVSDSYLRNVSGAISRCRMHIEGFIVSSIASGISCLVDDEKELGAAIIDIGGATTDVAVFMSGRPVFVCSFPVGGMHITSDIARGLTAGIATAERIKAVHGSAVVSQVDDMSTIDVPMVGEEADSVESNYIAKSALTRIISPRVEEIFELVQKRLDEVGILPMIGRVVITGGTANLVGIRDVAMRILGKPARIGRPVQLEGMAEATFGPAFATAAGMIISASTMAPRRNYSSSESVSPSQVGAKIMGWVRGNLLRKAS